MQVECMSFNGILSLYEEEKNSKSVKNDDPAKLLETLRSNSGLDQSPVSLKEHRSFVPSLNEITTSVERPRSLMSILEDLKTQPFYKDQIGQSLKVVPRRTAIYGTFSMPSRSILIKIQLIIGYLNFEYPANLWTELQAAGGFKSLYKHQADALNRIEDSRHVILTTSTSRYIIL